MGNRHTNFLSSCTEQKEENKTEEKTEQIKVENVSIAEERKIEETKIIDASFQSYKKDHPKEFWILEEDGKKIFQKISGDFSSARKREIAILRKLQSSEQHPNILHIYQYLEKESTSKFSDKDVGFQAEYLPYILEDATMPITDVAILSFIYTGISNALTHCHKNGIIHYDIAPANIGCRIPWNELTSPNDVVLFDFDLAYNEEAIKGYFEYIGRFEYCPHRFNYGPSYNKEYDKNYPIDDFEILIYTMINVEQGYLEWDNDNAGWPGVSKPLPEIQSFAKRLKLLELCQNEEHYLHQKAIEIVCFYENTFGWKQVDECIERELQKTMKDCNLKLSDYGNSQQIYDKTLEIRPKIDDILEQCTLTSQEITQGKKSSTTIYSILTSSYTNKKYFQKKATTDISGWRIKDEIDILRKLQQPQSDDNIIQIHRYLKNDMGFQSEYLPIIFKDNLIIADVAILQMIHQGIFNALAYCHQHDILHCDIAPANIGCRVPWQELTSSNQVVLFDFDLACVGWMQENELVCGHVKGREEFCAHHLHIEYYIENEKIDSYNDNEKNIQYYYPMSDFESLIYTMLDIEQGELDWDNDKIGFNDDDWAQKYHTPRLTLDSISAFAKRLKLLELCQDTTHYLHQSAVSVVHFCDAKFGWKFMDECLEKQLPYELCSGLKLSDFGNSQQIYGKTSENRLPKIGQN